MNKEEEAIVGNDSYEFNEATAKGGSYYLKNSIIQRDARFNIYCSNEETPEESDAEDSNVSAKSDYSTQFKANASSIMTSTLLEVNDILPNNDDLLTNGNEGLLSKISEIETKVSSFLMSIQTSFHDLKEIAKLNTNKQKIETDSSGQAIRLEPGNVSV